MNRSHALNVLGSMRVYRSLWADWGGAAPGARAHIARRDITALRMAEHLVSIATPEQIREAERRAKQANDDDNSRASVRIRRSA